MPVSVPVSVPVPVPVAVPAPARVDLPRTQPEPPRTPAALAQPPVPLPVSPLAAHTGTGDLLAALGDRESMTRQIIGSAFFALFAAALVAGKFPPLWLPGVFVAVFVPAFPVVSMLLTGRWPFSTLIGAVLGPEGSLQRSLVMTAAFSLPFLLFAYGASDTYLAFGLRALVTVALMFYLTGHANTWRGEGEQVRLVGFLGHEADSVFLTVQRMFENERFRPLQVRTLEVLEDRSFALAKEDAARRTVRLLEITQDRARVTMRSVDYGGHLYVRWDTFVEYSGVRFVLIAKTLLRLMSSAVGKLFGTEPTGFFAEVGDILFGARASTGGKFMQAALGGAQYVPSWVYDNLSGLSQLANQYIIQGAINPALERAQRPERLNLPEVGGRPRIL